MAMGLKLKHNGVQVLQALDAYAHAITEVAAPRAANDLRDQAKTVGLREIARIYGIGPRRFEPFVEVRGATTQTPEASLTVKGKGLPMYLFKPRVVRGRNGGIRITLKGRSVFIPHAFIAKIKNASERDPEAKAKIGVFARGAYGGRGRQEFTGERFGGRFHFGRKRLTINELFTFSRPTAFANPEVTAAMNKRVQEKMAAVFESQIRFATRG